MSGINDKVEHYGKWVIDEELGIVIDCYVTSNKRRLLSLRGTARAMGLKGGGSQALVRNLKSQWIGEYLTPELRIWLHSVQAGNIKKLKGPNGEEFIPFDGDLFVDLCKAYINAQKDGVFNNFPGNQDEIANKLLSIMSAFAKVGIIALIDEVTGYQEQRDKEELQKILAEYVREEFLPWTKRFPDEFYKEMFRLKGWEYKGKPKPPLVGKYTNKLIYEALPKSVLDEIQKINPIIETKNGKYRRYRHHQFLTEETGIPHLDKHLISVITLMRACDKWEQFETMFEKVFPSSKQEIGNK